MTTANISSRWAWAYESTPGTAEITAVDTTCYPFGVYLKPIGEWSPPTTENPAEPYYNYASREPQLTKLDKEYPVFGHEYNPVTPQWLSRFLKAPVTGTPITIGVLDSGKTYPITIRLEEREGTVPMLSQAVGCYTVGVTAIAEYNKPFRVREEWAWQKLEDEGDRAHLTTAPIASGGCDVSGAYMGTPHFTWNVTQRPEVWKVVYQQKQMFTTVYDPVTDTQTVDLFAYEAPYFIVNAIFKVTAPRDDFHDRNARACALKVYKADAATYINIAATNALATKWTKTGVANKGHYEATMTIKGEAISATANSCNTDFATHYKGAVA